MVSFSGQLIAEGISCTSTGNCKKFKEVKDLRGIFGIAKEFWDLPNNVRRIARITEELKDNFIGLDSKKVSVFVNPLISTFYMS